MVGLKPVQEILQNGSQVPEKYIQNNGEYQVLDGSLPLMDGPVVDFGVLTSSSSSNNRDELEKLRFALSSWGCCQVVSHGIQSELLDEVRGVAKEFFGQPLEEKEKYGMTEQGEGYGNDNVNQQGSFNWNDRLHLQVHPLLHRKLDFWPHNPSNFKQVLQEYSEKIPMILERIQRAMAESLKLEENRFFSLWDENDTIHARFNFYPRCPNATKVVGLRPHGDGTAITILLQDKEVEALQIEKDGQWFRVPIIADALLIIVGDQMEIQSNGVFKSPTHKVVINPVYNRISLAMLSIPNPDKEIGPLPELITEARPQLYKYLKDYGHIYLKHFPSGERQINAAKI